MEWLDRLNEAMTYVEEHLEGELSVEHVAHIAACSVFHFQRMFAYIANVSFSEYVRRRRMTRAAFDLMEDDVRVIDLAIKYGYESPTAFTRAFQRVHGLTPSDARITGAQLTAFPPLTFTVSIKGETAMNYRIEKKDAIRTVGVALNEVITLDEGMEKIPLFWNEMNESGTTARICELMDGTQPIGLLGISTCDDGEFSGYYIAVSTQKDIPAGMDEYIVPAGTWAIFECIGPMPDAMQNLQRRILTEWLPTSGYEYAAAPDIEIYGEGDLSASDYHSEAWLPIVKK